MNTVERAVQRITLTEAERPQYAKELGQLFEKNHDNLMIECKKLARRFPLEDPRELYQDIFLFLLERPVKFNRYPITCIYHMLRHRLLNRYSKKSELVFKAALGELVESEETEQMNGSPPAGTWYTKTSTHEWEREQATYYDMNELLMILDTRFEEVTKTLTQLQRDCLKDWMAGATAKATALNRGLYEGSGKKLIQRALVKVRKELLRIHHEAGLRGVKGSLDTSF